MSVTKGQGRKAKLELDNSPLPAGIPSRKSAPQAMYKVGGLWPSEPHHHEPGVKWLPQG